MYKKFEVKLNTPKDVSEFAGIASNCPKDVKVLASHGEYVVDAKSIMGLYSLNLSEPITIEIASGSNEDVDTYFGSFMTWMSNNT